MPDYITHLEQALLLPLTPPEKFSLPLSLSAFPSLLVQPLRESTANALKANLHIKNNEKVRPVIPLEAL